MIKIELEGGRIVVMLKSDYGNLIIGTVTLGDTVEYKGIGTLKNVSGITVIDYESFQIYISKDWFWEIKIYGSKVMLKKADNLITIYA